MPNKLSQFWQELKRRKVTRVITVYAAAAFVIIELVDIVAPNLGLPIWTFNFVLILLLVGFLITVIVSWIYDIHPEGGIVKTEPADKIKAGDTPGSSNSWKIASYISFVVIVGLIVLNIIPRTAKKKVSEVLDKSIAVLPFESLSNDEELQYQADGVMDAILLHLSKIEDLRVMSRTSVEQYRDTKKTIPEICEELGVAFVLEGSFQKSGDQIRLIVQLIQSGMEGHVWANNYDREWKDIFAVQSEVAQLVAGELEAVITPDEKQRMEKIPTENLTAYEFYQKGMDELNKYWLTYNRIDLESAERLFRYAMEYDSTMAEAYAGLSWVSYEKRSSTTYFMENFLDSMLFFADLSLAYDEQLSDGYVLRGMYFGEMGQLEQAIAEYDKAIALNPNNWWSYFGKAYYYRNNDIVNSLDNFYKCVSVYRGPLLPQIYRLMSNQYWHVGMIEKRVFYLEKALELDGDSSLYYVSLGGVVTDANDFKKAIEYRKRAYQYDSTNLDRIWFLAESYLADHQHDKALAYTKKWIANIQPEDALYVNFWHRIGYTFWMNGDEEEAMRYFNMQIEYCVEGMRLGREYAEQRWANYDLAGVYAFLGERDKAYENLRILDQRERMPFWLVTFIKRDPLFDSIRDEPGFQQFVSDVEAKYLAERERVQQWLEENEML